MKKRKRRKAPALRRNLELELRTANLEIGVLKTQLAERDELIAGLTATNKEQHAELQALRGLAAGGVAISDTPLPVDLLRA